MTTNLIVSQLTKNKNFDVDKITDPEYLPFDLTDEEYEVFPEHLKALNQYSMSQRLDIMRDMEFKFHVYDKDTHEHVGSFTSDFKTSKVMSEINSISLQKYNVPFVVDYTTLLLHIKTIMRLACYRKRYTIKRFYLKVDGFPEVVKSDMTHKIKKEFNGPFHILLKKAKFELFDAITSKHIATIKGETFKKLYLEFVDKTNRVFNNSVKFNKIIKDLLSSNETDFSIIQSVKIVKVFE